MPASNRSNWRLLPPLLCSRIVWPIAEISAAIARVFLSRRCDYVPTSLGRFLSKETLDTLEIIHLNWNIVTNIKHFDENKINKNILLYKT